MGAFLYIYNKTNNMGKKITLNIDGIELTKKDIKNRFDVYNSKYFNGKLGKCQFLWLLPNHCDYGAYNAYEKNGEILNKIWIGRNTYWTEEKLRELLVHEMIHMYIRTIERKKIDGLLGHGFRFRRQCRRLKRNYGLHIPIHSNFGYKKKELKPKFWEKVLLWLFDR